MKKFNLVEAIEKSFDAASETFKKQEGFHPMVFIDFEWIKTSGGKKAELGAIALLLTSDDMVDARRKIYQSLGMGAVLLQRLGVVGRPVSIRMASEAWMSAQSQEDFKKKGRAGMMRPADDPNRVEVLIASGMSEDLKSTMRMREIRRTKVSVKKGAAPHDEVVTLHDLGERFGDQKKEMDEEPQVLNPDDNVLSVFWRAFQHAQGRVPPGVEQFKDLDPEDLIGRTLKQCISAAMDMHELEKHA